jgi:hypothetical protein
MRTGTINTEAAAAATICQPPAARSWMARGVGVTGAKGFLTACVLAVSTVMSTTAWGAGELALPAGGRVGIIVMMSTDVTHYHVGKSPSASFMRTYKVEWPASEVVDDPLAGEIKNAGLEPVFLDPTEQLRRQRQQWIISTSQDAKLPNAAMAEMERILAAENLQALVIVTPGPNNNPEAVAGNRLRRLPAYVQGWGFSTSDDSGAKPVVFNLTQMLLIGKPGREVQLSFREWGGGFVYEWSDFDPGADLKTLPQTQIDKFRPVIEDVLRRQLARLMPHMKVG